MIIDIDMDDVAELEEVLCEGSSESVLHRTSTHQHLTDGASSSPLQSLKHELGREVQARVPG